MSLAILCRAIRTKNLVRFYYAGDRVQGDRIVEPHLVAYSATEQLVLSGWFLRGSSESQDREGWREYSVAAMTNIVTLHEHFAEPRSGYNPTGGKKLHNVQCAL